MKINWKWPNNGSNGKAPWYSLLRAILLLPVSLTLIVTLVVSYLCVLLLDGAKGAEEFARGIIDKG